MRVLILVVMVFLPGCAEGEGKAPDPVGEASPTAKPDGEREDPAAEPDEVPAKEQDEAPAKEQDEAPAKKPDEAGDEDRKLLQDPKAVAFMEKTVKRQYSVRGNEKIKSFRARIHYKSRREVDSMDWGSCTLEWTRDKHRYIDFSPEAQGSRNFEGWFSPLVGDTSFEDAKKTMNIRFDDEGKLVLENPEWSLNKSFKRIVFTKVDPKTGLLARRDLYDAAGKLIITEVYDFIQSGEARLLTKVTSDFPVTQMKKIFESTYRQVDGHWFPESLTVIDPAGVGHTLTVSDVRLNIPLSLD